MDRFTQKTQDGFEANIAKLKEVFPGAVKEGKIDFDTLKTMLGGEVTGDEFYDFSWAGKRDSIIEASLPTTQTLRPCPEDSKDWENSRNVYIEGDNLEALKILKNSYSGQVKMIYIDPPYNTGRDFIYHDNYHSSKKAEAIKEGSVDAETGVRYRTNTRADGAFHSDWCSMMYARLTVARDLLTDDGVIFISIDDNEYSNITKICNEVFGANNYRNTLLVRRRIKSLNSQFATNGLSSLNIAFEYILIYSKTEKFLMKAIRQQKENASEKGKWDVFWSNADRPTMRYDILGFTPTTGQWRNSKEKAELAVKNYIKYKTEFENKMSLEEYYAKTGISEFVRRISNGTGKNGGVQHWIPPSDTSLRTNNWTDIEVSQIEKEIDLPFDNPKSKQLLRELLRLTSLNTCDLIIDFFSGSATTAHAVMQLNAEDGGHRKFIMVQIPEVCAEGSEAAKAGYKNICEIGKERIRRAGEKIKKEHPEATDLDIGFRVFKVDSSNMEDRFYTIDNITQDGVHRMEDYVKDGRSGADLLVGCLLEWGIPNALQLPFEKCEKLSDVSFEETYSVDGGRIIGCFDAKIPEEKVRAIAKMKPDFAIFKECSIGDSSQKINAVEIFKAESANTKVRML